MPSLRHRANRLGANSFGALNVHLVTTFIASLLVLLLWTLASNVGAAIAFVVIFGAISGAVIGLPPASVAYILGPSKTQQAKLGQWTGMMYTGSAVFALTGPVIAGHLISEYRNYVTVQLWSGFSLLLSAVCMGAARWCARRRDEPGKLSMSRSTEVSTERSLIDDEKRRNTS